MYKAAVRHMIRRSIGKLNAGDYGPGLAMFAPDGDLCFPGDNSWSNQYRTAQSKTTSRGSEQVVTHRGRAEIEGFLQRYVSTGMHMVVEDILVNGPPWNTRAAARVHHWAEDADGRTIYANRAVLYVNTKWGRIIRQEDYEDTQIVAAFDPQLNAALDPPLRAPASS